jgi:hypothetical protein
MRYLLPTGGSVENLAEGFGILTSPAHRTIAKGIKEGRWWAADNEAFTRGFDPDRFFSWLKLLQPFRDRCLFVVVPDVVYNTIGTLERYRWWAWRIKERGWPVAFVAQDGQELLSLPPEFDWLFIGGSTEWKMSAAADDCIYRAKASGKRVHIGRVNGMRRFWHFGMIGADSADGTMIRFERNTCIQRFEQAANLLIALFGPAVSVINAFVFVSLDLTSRDALHDRWRGQHLIRNMALLIGGGSVLSFALAMLLPSTFPPDVVARVAIASFAAFGAAGLVDALMYQYLFSKGKGRLFRMNGSNVVSAAVDSIVFPALAFGFPLLWPIMLGQFVAKTLGGAVWSVILVKVPNLLRRELFYL